MIEQNENIEGLHPNGLTSVPSAAKLYDVHHSTLRRWWESGKFPLPVKQGDKNYFRNSELLEYNENLKQIETA